MAVAPEAGAVMAVTAVASAHDMCMSNGPYTNLNGSASSDTCDTHCCTPVQKIQKGRHWCTQVCMLCNHWEGSSKRDSLHPAADRTAQMAVLVAAAKAVASEVMVARLAKAEDGWAAMLDVEAPRVATAEVEMAAGMAREVVAMG